MKTKYDDININFLKKIVEESDSFPELTRKLGLDPQIGNTKKNIERLIKRNNISVTHFSTVQRLQFKYKKDVLINLTKKYSKFKDILLELDLLPIEGNYRRLKKYLNQYNIDYSHIINRNKSFGKSIVDYDENKFRKIVNESFSFADIRRAFGMTLTGGSNETIRKYIKKYNINISHFDPYKKIKRNIKNKMPIKEILIKESTYNSTSTLKQRLYDESLKERICELCGQDEEWRGKKMSLILDHINGTHNDNRIENLRIVCPNCNATLDTHCGKHKHLENRKIKKIEKRKNYIKHKKSIRNVERPPYNILVKEISEMGYLSTGRKYGVSDNAIRKWIKFYEKYENVI